MCNLRDLIPVRDCLKACHMPRYLSENLLVSLHTAAQETGAKCANTASITCEPLLRYHSCRCLCSCRRHTSCRLTLANGGLQETHPCRRAAPAPVHVHCDLCQSFDDPAAVILLQGVPASSTPVKSARTLSTRTPNFCVVPASSAEFQPRADSRYRAALLCWIVYNLTQGRGSRHTVFDATTVLAAHALHVHAS